MKTFIEFIKENITTTMRKGIQNFDNMKPLEFLNFAREILKNNNGRLENIEIDLKVDGAGIRFGKDKDGKFFLESSRSGPIQQKNSFSEYARKYGKNIERAILYDRLYDDLEESNIWKDLPNDTKIIAEILYNPMAEIKENKIKFVSVYYDKNKLGDLMTIIPFNVLIASTGSIHKEKEKIILKLLEKSNNKIKIETPKMVIKNPLKVSFIFDPLKTIEKDAETILTSRKKEDKTKKEIYLKIIGDVKKQFSEFLLDHPDILGKDKFGDEFEGFVLKFNQKTYKIQSKSYKEKIKQKIKTI